MQMLITKEAAQKIERALKLGVRATPEMSAEWQRSIAVAANGMPRNMSIADGVAEIRVEGVLTKRPDFWSWLLYGSNTTYESIRQGLALAAADPFIKRVSVFVDSPGGHVDGLFDALAALEAFQKPMTVRASYACSAAFAIAALAGKIEATNEAAEFGSIGVAVSYFWDEHIIDLTSTDAPNKRPNPTTEEGKAVIVAELDALHELFVDAIARGRGTTVEDINQNFGRGGVLLAAAAKKVGMIDKIAKPSVRAVTVTPEPGADEAGPEPVANVGQIVAALREQAARLVPQESSTEPAAPVAAPAQNNASAAAGGAQPTRKNMTEAELRAQHPELFAALDKKHETAVASAKADGIKEGTDTERKRVLGHIKLGDAAGDLKMAHDAIASGASTADVHDDYLAARMRRGAVENRQTETDTANAAADGAKAAEAKGARELVADEVERLMGGPPDEE
jgi:ClpP class serine protease